MKKLLFTGKNLEQRMKSISGYSPKDFFNYGRFSKEGNTKIWTLDEYSLEIYDRLPYYAFFEKLKPRKHPIKKFKLSSYAWQKAYRDYLQVLDPDGWNRKDLHPSMSEKISRNEFLRRVYHSTCRFNLQLIKFI